MPIKTITLSPAAYLIRDEPAGALVWAPTVGSASMLSSQDGDNANCVNSTGLAQDSDALDARTFRTAGALPVFESDARDPLLKISCYMKANDSKNAQPAVIIFDTGDFSKFEQRSPYATVNGAGWYERTLNFPNVAGVDIFAMMAAGRFAVSCIFPSRPTETGYPCASFNWDAVQATLTYTYGPDTTPDPFDFANKPGPVNTVTVSDVLTIGGFTGAQAVTISGEPTAQFSIAGGAFGTSGNITPGQTLQLRMTAGAAVGNVRTCTVNVEAQGDAWSVTAGTDNPTTVSAPTDRTNYIPAFWIPNTAIIPTSAITWQFSGHTIPAPFHFRNSPWPVQYSVNAPNGPWTDGVETGSVGNFGQVYIRLKTPPGPSQTATVRITYGSSNLTDEVLISTGAESVVYSVDLSPIDAFQNSSVTGPAAWSPVVSGAARHLSVAAPSSRALGTPFGSGNSNLDAGQWWRQGDGSPMEWPPGSKITGIGYGGKRTIFHPQSIAGNNVVSYYVRNPGGTYVQQPLLDQAYTSNTTVVLGTSPGAMPSGWTAETLLAALVADQFAMARRAHLSDSGGYSHYSDSYDLRLRVFFQVVKPPFGYLWEG